MLGARGQSSWTALPAGRSEPQAGEERSTSRSIRVYAQTSFPFLSRDATVVRWGGSVPPDYEQQKQFMMQRPPPASGQRNTNQVRVPEQETSGSRLRVRVNFKVHYRVHSRQMLCMGGSKYPFGWSFLSIVRLPMTWNMGDFWTVEVELDPAEKIEYKYVILEEQGWTKQRDPDSEGKVAVEYQYRDGTSQSPPPDDVQHISKPMAIVGWQPGPNRAIEVPTIQELNALTPGVVVDRSPARSRQAQTLAQQDSSAQSPQAKLHLHTTEKLYLGGDGVAVLERVDIWGEQLEFGWPLLKPIDSVSRGLGAAVPPTLPGAFPTPPPPAPPPTRPGTDPGTSPRRGKDRSGGNGNWGTDRGLDGGTKNALGAPKEDGEVAVLIPPLPQEPALEPADVSSQLLVSNLADRAATRVWLRDGNLLGFEVDENGACSPEPADVTDGSSAGPTGQQGVGSPGSSPAGGSDRAAACGGRSAGASSPRGSASDRVRTGTDNVTRQHWSEAHGAAGEGEAGFGRAASSEGTCDQREGRPPQSVAGRSDGNGGGAAGMAVGTGARVGGGRHRVQAGNRAGERQKLSGSWTEGGNEQQRKRHGTGQPQHHRVSWGRPR